MIKNRLFRYFYVLFGVVLLCSFVFFRSSKEIDLEQNELAYSDTKITLNFGGIEELIPSEKQVFRSDVYLSDINLNDAGFYSKEQVVMLLSNQMLSSRFVNGNYSIVPEFQSGETGVKAKLLSLNGSETDIEVVSGTVEYEGTYPQVHLTFDFLLSNGEKLRGSYFKKMQSFKYYF